MRTPHTNKRARKAGELHREVTDFLAFALAIIFVFRTFVAEPLQVASDSMQPYLLGRRTTAVCPSCRQTTKLDNTALRNREMTVPCPQCGEILPTHCLLAQRGTTAAVLKNPPDGYHRYDVVVFKSPDRPRDRFVKRIVGLPGETIRIRRGEIEVAASPDGPFRICRKPFHTIDSAATLIHDSRLPGQHNPWCTNLGSWNRQGNGFVVTSSESPASLAYRPVPGGPFRITDAQSPNLLGNLVDDWILDFNLRPSPKFTRLAVTFHNSLGDLQFIWDANRQDLELHHDGERVWQQAANATPHQTAIRFAHVDRQIILGIDGKLLAMIPYDSQDPSNWASVRETNSDRVDAPQPDIANGNVPVHGSLRSPNSGPDNELDPINIRVTGHGTCVTGLVLQRDVYYRRTADTIDRPALSGPVTLASHSQVPLAVWTLGQDEYFLLGDNSPRSVDSRHWIRGPAVRREMIMGRVIGKLW